MRRFTKSLFAFLLLMTAGVLSVHAERVNADLTKYTNNWDAAGQTLNFTWSAQWGNQLAPELDLPKGDLTGWEKLVVVTAELGNCDFFRVLVYNGEDTNHSNTFKVNKTDTISFTLAGNVDFLDNVTKIVLSGSNGEDSKKDSWEQTPASFKVKAVYLERPDDPLALPKDNLKKLISKAKSIPGFAYTSESFSQLTNFISVAEGVLVKDGLTLDDLNTASTNLNGAINGLALAEGYANLTADMFKHYASLTEPGEGTATGCAFTMFEPSDLPFGDGNVGELNWADLTQYDKLIVAVSGATKPRFCLNRLVAGGQQAATQADSKMLDINPNNDYTWSTEEYQTITDNLYQIDLKAIVEDYKFARLHCIKKQGYGEGVNITGLYLYKAPEFKPAYGTIWENGETTADGDYTLISLNKAYFNDFAKVADTLKIDFNVVSASRAAAPARNIKKGEISLWAGTDELFTLSNIMANVDNINIAFTEDMIAKLAAADAVTLKFKNMTVSKVVLAEKIVPPFQPTDVTAKVNQNGWQSAVGSVGPYTKDVAQKEQYLENTTTNGEILYQTVEGLENGTYTVELYANASYTAGRGFASTALNGDLGRVIIYAGDVEKTIPVIYQTAVAENNIVKLENVVVSDGTLKMGMRKDLEGSNWHTIQIKSLVHVSLEANADEAAQNEYWKGIATTILGTEAYANIAGSEKAAMVAAETKAAVKAAIAPFYAAKEAYDALVDIINKGKSVDMDMTEAETLLNSATTTADQAAAKAAELKHTVNLAVNTKAVEGANAENPVVTNFVINGTFDQNGVVAPWKTTTNAQNQTTANNQQGAFTGNFFENWNPSAYTGKIYQEIEDIPNGNYTLKIAAFVETFDATAQFVYANGDQVALTAGEPTAYEVKTVVVDNKIEIGLNQIAAVNRWMGIDNVSLVYYGETNIAELVAAYNNALLAAQAVEGKMNKDVKAALLAAINAEVDETNADQLAAATAALVAATNNAKASVAAYTKAAGALNNMSTLTANTNFYTAEALENYYTKWALAYEADTLKTDEANALQDPFIITGYRADNSVDDLLMSVWDENPMNWDSYHVNTWSTEGGSDGTGFVVPFIEYWIEDANSLAAKTLTATVSVEKDGIYDVEAWVRVRVKNGESVADGITMTVNDGDAVDVCAGTPVDNSKFYLDNFTARGIVENNTLTLKFIVADGNNISWLAFRDVKYTFNEEATTGISSIENVKTLNGNIYNLNGQKVEKAQKGLYIMNGKKVYVK